MTYVAEYHATDGTMTPYALADHPSDALREARRQIAGAGERMKRFMMPRIVARGVDDDEASEIAEYFSTPWG